MKKRHTISVNQIPHMIQVESLGTSESESASRHSQQEPPSMKMIEALGKTFHKSSSSREDHDFQSK